MLTHQTHVPFICHYICSINHGHTNETFKTHNGQSLHGVVPLFKSRPKCCSKVLSSMTLDTRHAVIKDARNGVWMQKHAPDVSDLSHTRSSSHPDSPCWQHKMSWNQGSLKVSGVATKKTETPQVEAKFSEMLALLGRFRPFFDQRRMTSPGLRTSSSKQVEILSMSTGLSPKVKPA